MKPRSLTILNAIGCVILTVFVVMQWRRELASDASMVKLTSELALSKAHAETEAKHAADLERDIAAFKQSIETMRTAAEDSTRVADENKSLITGLQAEVTNAHAQIKTWQDALAGRDAKLVELTAHLNATRMRLEDAVAKLKQTDAP